MLYVKSGQVAFRLPDKNVSVSICVDGWSVKQYLSPTRLVHKLDGARLRIPASGRCLQRILIVRATCEMSRFKVSFLFCCIGQSSATTKASKTDRITNTINKLSFTTQTFTNNDKHILEQTKKTSKIPRAGFEPATSRSLNECIKAKANEV